MAKLSDLFAQDVQQDLENTQMSEVLDGKPKISGKKLIDQGTVEVSRLVHFGLKNNILFELIESYCEHRESGCSPKQAVEFALEDWAVL